MTIAPPTTAVAISAIACRSASSVVALRRMLPVH
jgi:hypothetical protein